MKRPCSVTMACLAAVLLLPLAAAFGRVIPVHLSWPEDPQTTVTVFWERDDPGRGTVWYGLTTNYGDSVSDPGGYRRHIITLRDLQPDTMYHYKVSSSDGFEAADRTFWTAPAPTGSVDFVVHGDLQGGLDEYWARTVVNSIVADDPKLVIHIGDMAIEDPAYGVPGFSTWDTFFNICTDELENVVFMPCAGNHDDPADGNSFLWRAFAVPDRPAKGRYFSYDVGNIHFTVLDSDIDIASQTNWLARDLQRAANDTNITWIIPYLHRPPYSWGERGGDDTVKSNWCPVFVKYEADIVFSGHSHNYQRTWPIRGVTYVVSGGGGGRLYWTTSDAALAYHTSCYHFVSMQVTGSVMRYRAIRSDDLVFEDLVISNEGRFVRVDPVFPRRGDAVKISYDNSRGPLSGAGTVYIHLGVDAFSGAMVSSAMTYNAGSGRWEYEWTVPATAMHRLAWCFYDGGSTWDNNYTYNWQALLDRVEILPAVPTAGAPVAIRYEEEIGPLAGKSPVYARVGFNNWAQTLDADPVMTNNAVEGVLECQLAVPGYAEELNVVFYSGSTWDENEGIQWHAAVAGATAAPPWQVLPLVVPGSPLVTTNPPQQNNIGDNFDFDMFGTPVRTRDAERGFGDLGEIYLNHDATNLYIGGIGADLGGSNNVFVLFLGLDTLTDNAENLWHKSGKPNTLDFMHNVTLTEPLDIAIVLGSEWGDGPGYTNFTYAGYNFGQGVYYIGTNCSAFVPMSNAGLSQFDGTGTTACATNDVDGDERTDRWEARLPWADLNAPSGIDSVDCILLAGVVASDSTNGNDRYLSSTWIGNALSAVRDTYGNYGYGVVVIEPAKVLLESGDYDDDGLPNAWEHENFGSAQGPDRAGDQDGDTFSNWGEYVAGTQPTNGSSYFAATPGAATEDAFVISWPGASGRTYTVYKATNITDTFQSLVTNLEVNSYTDTVSGAGSGHYKVEVRY